MFGLGIGELVIIVFVVLLLFGGSKLPQLGGALGKSITNFKRGLHEGVDHNNELPGPAQSEKDRKSSDSQV